MSVLHCQQLQRVRIRLMLKLAMISRCELQLAQHAMLTDRLSVNMACCANHCTGLLSVFGP
jgi:hypothetical protein